MVESPRNQIGEVLRAEGPLVPRAEGAEVPMVEDADVPMVEDAQQEEGQKCVLGAAALDSSQLST